MARLIPEPTRIEAAGNLPKVIAVCVPAFTPGTVHRDGGEPPTSA